MKSRMLHLKKLTWVIVLVLLASCSSDLGYETITDAGSLEIGAESVQTHEFSRNSVDARESILCRLLGRITRLVTPLLGGTLEISTSRLVIPPNAVVLPTLVTWQIVLERPQGLQQPLDRIYDFYPHGLIFLIPSTLYVSFENAGLDGRDPYQYRCYYYNGGTRLWEPQPTEVDLQGGRFIVTLNHFSRYAFAR